MKKILLLAALASVFTVSSTYAQNGQKPVRGERMTRQSAREMNIERAQKTADRLEKDLQLTDIQKKNVMGIAVNSYNEKQTPESTKRFDDEVNKLLTPEQKARKAQLDAARIENMKAQQTGRASAPAPVK